MQTLLCLFVIGAVLVGIDFYFKSPPRGEDAIDQWVKREADREAKRNRKLKENE